jgi:RNA polymerase sigma-70 factor, ECF subfamily
MPGGDVEKAILDLSDEHRLVFLLRDVEGISTEETAESLNLTQENIKVRVHRARSALRRQLYAAVAGISSRCFQLHATRCNRVVKHVFEVLGLQPS